jgi:hypothetical protein
MDQATLDIKYSELLQWLLDRYLIPKDWPNRLEIIKSKKAEVIETLFNSDNEDFQKIKKMFKIFESTPIDSISYNDYQKLYQQLTKTKEAKEKTFFGNYKSPFIYNAYILDYLYQKNNLFLAENSKIIIQNISYEIPNCLKMIEELKEQIDYQKNKNLEKKEEINKNENKLKIKLKEYNIDIDSEKITTSNQIALSLIDKIEKNNSFENTLKTIEQNIKNNSLVQQGIELYEYCYNSLYNNLNIEQDQNDKNKEKEKEKEGQNKKNKKHQKFKKNKSNQKKEKEIKDKEENKENINLENGDNKNFVFETFTPTLKKFVQNGDYILGQENEKNENIDINRQGYINSLIKKYKMKYIEQSDIKDFKFNIVGDNTNSNLSKNNENNNQDDKEYKETCLINHHERNLLLADINEIIIFLEQRILNLENNIEINLTIHSNELKDYNMKYNLDIMTKIKEELEKIVKLLTEKNFVFLCNVLDDENNIKDVTDIYNEIKIKNMKLNNLINSNEKKNGELEIEIKDTQKKINELRKTTVNIKKITEVTVTKLLKRKINIIGDEYLFNK